MEFFRIIDKQATEEQLQTKIHPKSIENFTESMLFIENVENNFMGLTLWGEFNISYHKINGGVRFALLNCPNALSWTITTGFTSEQNKIVLHCIINKKTAFCRSNKYPVYFFIGKNSQGIIYITLW